MKNTDNICYENPNTYIHSFYDYLCETPYYFENYSEAGKVLTTMQAGDFFGEIGILNLDGLNK